MYNCRIFLLIGKENGNAWIMFFTWFKKSKKQNADLHSSNISNSSQIYIILYFWKFLQCCQKNDDKKPPKKSNIQIIFSFLGNYLYIEASGHKYSDNAVLLSPVIPPTGMSGYCFTFWYHMFGPNIGVLSVYSMIGGRKILQFTKGGTQGNQWKQAVINVNSTTDFQVRFTLHRCSNGWVG